MTEHPPSSPPDPDSWQPLPCGAAIDELLEQVAQGHAADQTPHQRDCPHCQATLTELDPGHGYRGLMPGRDDHNASRPVPAQYPATSDPAGSHFCPVPTAVVRDGASWPLGTATDVAWITESTTIDTTITSAIPAVFDAYATVVLPEPDDQERHDEALASVLRAHSGSHPWWLGYLDTGADDVVFPDAPRVSLYSNWPYVLVQAGPAQAATWRRWDHGSFWSGHLPNLMFPTDRSWLVSTLWDDDWTCIGGPTPLVDRLLHHPDLRDRSRRVAPGQDATPPGHQAM